MQRRGEFEERAIFPQQESLALGKLVVVPAKRVSREPSLVRFVRAEVLDGVNAVGERRRTLVWREVTDEIGAAAWDCLSAVAGVLLKLGLLSWIDMVADDAGDHGVAPCYRQTLLMPCRRSVLLRAASKRFLDDRAMIALGQFWDGGGSWLAQTGLPRLRPSSV